MDTGIDMTLTLQPSQIALIGVLSGVLLIWMFVFAWLALRPTAEAKATTRAAPQPAAPPTPVKLHTIVQAPVTVLAQETNEQVALEHSTR